MQHAFTRHVSVVRSGNLAFSYSCFDFIHADMYEYTTRRCCCNNNQVDRLLLAAMDRVRDEIDWKPVSRCWCIVPRAHQIFVCLRLTGGSGQMCLHRCRHGTLSASIACYRILESWAYHYRFVTYFLANFFFHRIASLTKLVCFSAFSSSSSSRLVAVVVCFACH